MGGEGSERWLQLTVAVNANSQGILQHGLPLWLVVMVQG